MPFETLSEDLKNTLGNEQEIRFNPPPKVKKALNLLRAFVTPVIRAGADLSQEYKEFKQSEKPNQAPNKANPDTPPK